MKFYLIRHGESLGNATGIYLGHMDWDLSELGREQAEMAAAALSDVCIDAVYSSDLVRAVNTAKPHALMRGLSVNAERELRELYLGEWEGKKITELEKDSRFTEGWRKNYGTFQIPGGESVQGGAERIFRALSRIGDKNPDKTVLCVMHAAVIRAFWCKISSIPPEEWAERVEFPYNSSITVVEYENGSFKPVEYSNVRHLKNVNICFQNHA